MRKLTFLIASLIFSLSGSITFAQDSVVGEITAPSTKVITNIGETGTFISVIVRFITVIAGIYAMWQFLTGGFGFITSSGDKAKVQQSTQQIMMAILGLAIIGASFILSGVVGRLLFGEGFDLFAPTLQVVK